MACRALAWCQWPRPRSAEPLVGLARRRALATIQETEARARRHARWRDLLLRAAPAGQDDSSATATPALEHALREYFGLTASRPGQAAVYQAVLDGRDTLAILPTGAGKSLCFQLPAMLLDGVTVGVSPLVALMKDQLDGLPPAVRVRATLINATLAPDEIAQRLRDLAAGAFRLLYVAPERLGQPTLLAALRWAEGARLVAVLRVDAREAREEALVALCASEPGSTVVYTNSRERCERLAALLARHGLSARYYHAGLGGDERAVVRDAFMRGQVRAIVATVAFGMGVDTPDSRLVVHVGLPRSLEPSAQETGRAGRDGRPARCVLLVSPGDGGQLARWAAVERLQLDDLRQVYRTVRARLSGAHQGVIDERGVGSELPGDDGEPRGRVALGLLERADILQRLGVAPARVQVDASAAPGAVDDPALGRLPAEYHGIRGGAHRPREGLQLPPWLPPRFLGSAPGRAVCSPCSACDHCAPSSAVVFAARRRAPDPAAVSPQPLQTVHGLEPVKLARYGPALRAVLRGQAEETAEAM